MKLQFTSNPIVKRSGKRVWTIRCTNFFRRSKRASSWWCEGLCSNSKTIEPFVRAVLCFGDSTASHHRLPVCAENVIKAGRFVLSFDSRTSIYFALHPLLLPLVTIDSKRFLSSFRSSISYIATSHVHIEGGMSSSSSHPWPGFMGHLTTDQTLYNSTIYYFVIHRDTQRGTTYSILYAVRQEEEWFLPVFSHLRHGITNLVKQRMKTKGGEWEDMQLWSGTAG